MMIDLNAFLPYVNGPLGFLFRHALWIPDRKHRVSRIDKNGHHLYLGDGKYRAVLYTCNQHIEAAYKNLDWFMRSAHTFDIMQPALNFGFDTYTSQPAEAASTDTMIIQESATTNYGTDAGLYIGENNGAAQLVRTLIQFDLTSLPTLYVPSTGTLSLWLYSNQSSNLRSYRMYRVIRNWVESEATWNIYSTGNNWATAGGYDASDCELTHVASTDLAAAASTGEKTWDIDATSLEEMCNGIWTNHGWLMKNATEVNDQQRFRSSNYGTAGERPKLVFTYYPQDSGGILL